MSRHLFAAAAIASALAISAFAGASPSRADANAPVCAMFYALGGGYTQCDFYSYAQCQATIYGRGGQCFNNTDFRESLNRMPQHVRSRR